MRLISANSETRTHGRVSPPVRQQWPAVASFSAMNEGGNFTWNYLTGSDLKNRVVYPNGVTVDYTYEPNRDLLTNAKNYHGDTTYSEYSYSNDALGRRTVKNSETYGYNSRNELTSASTGYAYAYDDIGNHITAAEPEDSTEYTANALNQYSIISNLCVSVPLWETFTPTYDLDGNKNVSDVISVSPYNQRTAHYEYAPFGEATSAVGWRTTDNPYRFSSEFHDDTLGLVYYNYRHYNPKDGRWMSRDLYHNDFTFYLFVGNFVMNQVDYLGNVEVTIMPTFFLFDLGSEEERDDNITIKNPNRYNAYIELSNGTYGYTLAKLNVFVTCDCDANVGKWKLADAHATVQPIVHLRNKLRDKFKEAFYYYSELDHVNDIISWANSSAVQDLHTRLFLSKDYRYKTQELCQADNFTGMYWVLWGSYNKMMEDSKRRWDYTQRHTWPEDRK